MQLLLLLQWAIIRMSASGQRMTSQAQLVVIEKSMLRTAISASWNGMHQQYICYHHHHHHHRTSTHQHD